MLFLLFQIGDNRYLVEARQVAEILPLVDILAWPQSPAGVAGLLDYRGTLVPAVDLAQIVLGRPTCERLHTRIVLLPLGGENGQDRLLGLIVEKVTEIRRLGPADFSAPGATASQAGALLTDQIGLAERIDVRKLLPSAIRELLQQAVPSR